MGKDGAIKNLLAKSIEQRKCICNISAYNSKKVVIILECNPKKLHFVISEIKYDRFYHEFNGTIKDNQKSEEYENLLERIGDRIHRKTKKGEICVS